MDPGSNGFVAVGANGTMLASSHGLGWTPRTSRVATQLNVITYATHVGYIAGGAQALYSFRATARSGLLLVQGRAQPASAPAITAQAVNAGGTFFFSAGATALADASYQCGTLSSNSEPAILGVRQQRNGGRRSVGTIARIQR